jgi:serine/threonine-protein kinase
MLQMRDNLTSYVELEIPPDALALKAQETIRQLGYSGKPVDSAHGFLADRDFLNYIRDHDKSAQRWERLRNGRPWYRESNQPLEWQGFYSRGVTRSDPPPVQSGMKEVLLDPSGVLVSFSAVPDQVESGVVQGAVDWRALFSAAGIDPGQFKPALPRWVPPSFADTRAAWESKSPSGEPLRIEAAAYRGKPVYFQMIGPWTRPSQMQPAPVTTGQRVAQGINITVFVIVCLGGVLIARRNVSLGRGDRRGAARLAMGTLIAMLTSLVLITSHVATSYELGIMVMHLSNALFFAALIWVLYLALEPYVRRRWPNALIASGKVLAGRFRDPLVGRDVLIGSAAGVATGMLFPAIPLLTRALGGVTSAPSAPTTHLDALSSLRFALGYPFFDGASALFLSFVAIFLMFAARIVLKKNWLVFAAILVIGSTVMIGQGYNVLVAALFGVIVWTLLPVVMIRFGLLATFCMIFVSDLVDTGVTDFTGWHAYSVWISLGVIAAIACAAFYTSLAGRPLFTEALFES